MRPTAALRSRSCASLRAVPEPGTEARVGENIAQTLQFVESAQPTTSGSWRSSLALAPPIASPRALLGDPAGHISANRAGRHYPEDSKAAREFRAFLLSAGGRRILKQYGFFRAGRMIMDWQAIWLSVRLAASTTAISAGTRSARRLLADVLPRRWKFLVEALVALPLVLPADRARLLCIAGDRSAQPAWRDLLRSCTGGCCRFPSKAFCWPACCTAFRSPCTDAAAAFAGVDRKLLGGRPWCLGVSRAATFRRVIVPLSLCPESRPEPSSVSPTRWCSSVWC
jgi:hypothetical protein